jgi:hypothetical protein
MSELRHLYVDSHLQIEAATVHDRTPIPSIQTAPDLRFDWHDEGGCGFRFT